MTVTAAAVRVLRARDGGRCAAEGPWCVGALTTQHRANRGAGGSGLRDGFENLLTLCWGCNTRLEADAEWAAYGRLNGWKLRSWEDPLGVAVLYLWAGEWRKLDADGGWSPAVNRLDEAAPAADWRA